MPEQITGPNTGVPMSNGGGGTVEQGNNTQGGGGSTVSGTSGAVNPAPTAAPAVDWSAEVARTNEALDVLLTQPGFVISYQQFVGLFISAKYSGLFNSLNVSEEVKEEEMAKLKEYYETHGKQAMKKEYAKLKEAYSDAIKGFKEIVPQITSTIIDVFMPQTFTGIPNVGSKLLQAGIRILNILVAIQHALRLAKKYLDLAEEFGLQNFVTTQALVNALKPMVQQVEFVESQIQKLGLVFNKEDADSMNAVVKNKLTQKVSKRLDTMTSIAEEVLGNISEGESAGDNKKSIKRFFKLYNLNRKNISEGFKAYEMATDNSIGTLSIDEAKQLQQQSIDLYSAMQLATNIQMEARALDINKRLKLDDSVMEYINQLMDDFAKEETTISIMDYGKKFGFKLKNY